jgi:hypothetical protein
VLWARAQSGGQPFDHAETEIVPNCRRSQVKGCRARRSAVRSRIDAQGSFAFLLPLAITRLAAARWSLPQRPVRDLSALACFTDDHGVQVA